MKLHQRKLNKLDIMIKQFLIGKVGQPLFKELDEKSKNCKQAQHDSLMEILQSCKDTAFGKEKQFDKIADADDYRAAVPLLTYNDIHPYIERMLKGEQDVLFKGKPIIYNTTSGTTDKPKLIPISQAYYDGLYSKQSRLFFASILKENPQFLSGYNFSVISKAVEGYKEDGIPFGAMSGHVYLNIPGFLKNGYSIPYDVFKIENYDSRYYCMIRFAIMYDVTYLITINPTSLFHIQKTIDKHLDVLLEDIHKGTLTDQIDISSEIRSNLSKKLKPNPKLAKELQTLVNNHDQLMPKHFWPNLSVVNSWANGNCKIYREKMMKLLPDTIAFREFGYQSTEIRAGVSLQNDDLSSILMCHLAFYEFIKCDEMECGDSIKTYLAHELEIGESYYFVFTGPNGLYRYQSHDIIQVVGFHNEFPKIIFIQKGKGVTNLVGEKLYESQMLASIERGITHFNLKSLFHISFADLTNLVYHTYIEIEPPISNSVVLKLATYIDQCLCETNMEYSAKRNSMRLKSLHLHLLEPDSFFKFKTAMKKQGQDNDAQFKMIHLMQDEKKRMLFEQWVIKPT
jgi:hypothetical protein